MTPGPGPYYTKTTNLFIMTFPPYYEVTRRHFHSYERIGSYKVKVDTEIRYQQKLGFDSRVPTLFHNFCAQYFFFFCFTDLFSTFNIYWVYNTTYFRPQNFIWGLQYLNSVEIKVLLQLLLLLFLSALWEPIQPFWNL